MDQQAGHLFLALNHTDIRRFKGLPNHVLYDSRDGGGALRRLQNGTIPGGYGTDQRFNQQLERIIERPDNQYGSVGLAENQAFGREHMQR
ncbi:hypothetical protein D3C73_1427910 [compost metagenome]